MVAGMDRAAVQAVMQRRKFAKQRLLSGEAQVCRKLNFTDYVWEIMFSPCGTRLAVLSDQQ